MKIKLSSTTSSIVQQGWSNVPWSQRFSHLLSIFSLFTASHFVALLLENLWLPGLVKWINSISENDRNVEWMLYKCLMEILSSEIGMVNQLNIVESEGNVEIVWPGLWRAIESLSKTTEDSEVDKKQLHKTAKKCKWISEIRGTFVVVLLLCETPTAPFPCCLQTRSTFQDLMSIFCSSQQIFSEIWQTVLLKKQMCLQKYEDYKEVFLLLPEVAVAVLVCLK